MDKYKQRYTQIKAASENADFRKTESRLMTYQQFKNNIKEEDLEEQENTQPSVNPLLLKNQYLKKTRPSLLTNIQNTMSVDKLPLIKEQSAKEIDKFAKHPYKHLVGANVDKNNFKKHMTMMFKGTVYSLKFLKGPSQKYLSSKALSLPQPKEYKKKFLVLDLDQTLIHSVSARQKFDAIIKLQDSQTLTFNIRPYCYQFLEKMNEHFAIYVFTASTPGYANPIIQYLNRKVKTIHGVLSRPHCMETRNGFYIKDLRIIKNRQLKDIVMVDNLVHSFGLQIDNGIPILQFINDVKDQQLKHIQKILLELKEEEDVRVYLDKKLNLKKIADLTEKQLLV